MPLIEVEIETSDVLLMVHFSATMDGHSDSTYILSMYVDDEHVKTLTGGFGKEVSAHPVHLGELVPNLPPDVHKVWVDCHCNGEVNIENPVLIAHEIGGPVITELA